MTWCNLHRARDTHRHNSLTYTSLLAAMLACSINGAGQQTYVYMQLRLHTEDILDRHAFCHKGSRMEVRILRSSQLELGRKLQEVKRFKDKQ